MLDHTALNPLPPSELHRSDDSNGHPRRSLKSRVKSLVERSLGVSISRHAPDPPNQHADDALRYLRSWSSSDVVFDVGANDGRTILRLQHQLAAPAVFAFEPVSGAYEKLVTRTAHLPNVRTFRMALGAAPGEAPIHVSHIDAMSSFAPNWTPQAAAIETVAITTVDEVMTSLGLDVIHFLKIDTEGYELEVLKGAERALRASRIAMVQVEVGVDQMPKPLVSLETVRAYLAERGYYLYGLYNQCRTTARRPGAWPDRGGDSGRPEVLAYCDALFIRADLPCDPGSGTT